nr:YggS family pyridoxal phosphate-dependent enzyme [Sanguibacter suaedae]
MPLTDAVTRVLDRVGTACSAAGRDPSEVRLLLATKTQDAATVRAAVTAARGLAASRSDGGPQVLVGENRVQELVEKAPDLADLALTAHLIGPVQSNKVNLALRALATHAAACVESIDSAALATRFGDRAVEVLAAPLDVLVQVNVSGEPTKSGVAPADARTLAEVVAAHPGLALRGFMTIGANSTDEALVRRGFAELRRIRDDVLSSGSPGLAGAVELSMGMSRDLEVAVAEGATIVRVGTAVFGTRQLP